MQLVIPAYQKVDIWLYECFLLRIKVKSTTWKSKPVKSGSTRNWSISTYDEQPNDPREQCRQDNKDFSTKQRNISHQENVILIGIQKVWLQLCFSCGPCLSKQQLLAVSTILLDSVFYTWACAVFFCWRHTQTHARAQTRTHANAHELIQSGDVLCCRYCADRRRRCGEVHRCLSSSTRHQTGQSKERPGTSSHRP